MTGRSLRPGGALAVTAALVLAGTVLASPAHADSTCTVNGVPVPGPLIRGTESADTIVCADGVDAATTVDALGGDDVITLTGAVSGVVRGGAGDDHVTLTSGTLTGGVESQEGADTLEINGVITGHVRAGQGDDGITATDVGSGGEIRGAKGKDTITVSGAVASGGFVHGNEDADTLHVNSNEGTVSAGGDPGDQCTVDMGLPCVD
ncbi:hypothetical protein ACSNOH_12880 [Streptomyces sp. URMC 127]|uniref:hypothetical protein n=1 Tax=Streptomyces sp. URMC 127 TaxID=3423402 RepID=UPI003F1D2AFA